MSPVRLSFKADFSVAVALNALKDFPASSLGHLKLGRYSPQEAHYLVFMVLCLPCHRSPLMSRQAIKDEIEPTSKIHLRSLKFTGWITP
jgi:hypothetical protein